MEERLYLLLDRLIETLQPPAIKSIGEIKPTGAWSPTTLFTSIVPAVGGTLVDYPTILLASTDSPPPTPPSPPKWGAEGFEVSVTEDKVAVSGGKVWWGGKEWEVPPTTLPRPKLEFPWSVVVNLMTREVSITITPSAVEYVLYTYTPTQREERE